MASSFEILFDGIILLLAIGGIFGGVIGWLAYGSGNQSTEGLIGILVVLVGLIVIMQGGWMVYQVMEQRR